MDESSLETYYAIQKIPRILLTLKIHYRWSLFWATCKQSTVSWGRLIFNTFLSLTPSSSLQVYSLYLQRNNMDLVVHYPLTMLLIH
jgi:hypothetical protein